MISMIIRAYMAPWRTCRARPICKAALAALVGLAWLSSCLASGVKLQNACCQAAELLRQLVLIRRQRLPLPGGRPARVFVFDDAQKLGHGIRTGGRRRAASAVTAARGGILAFHSARWMIAA